MTSSDELDAVTVNRLRWDELAILHGPGDAADKYYDVPGFLDGDSSLRERDAGEMEAAVGSVEGLDLLHIQCHFGMDTLSWARLGARVVGVDFSTVAIERARRLATRTGLSAEFVVGDSQDLPRELEGRFDVAFASHGVLCWIADVGAWMGSAAAALRPGGKLVLVDIHPVYLMFDTVDPPVLDFPYQGAEPHPFDSPGSYADSGAPTTANATVQFAHGLGEIVTAASNAGLRVDALTEWLDEAFDPRGDVLARDDDGRYRLHVGGQDLPVLFGLSATKA